MIERRKESDAVRGLLARNPVVGIIGARQVGKTTLARQIVAKDKRPHTFFDLENSEDISRLSDPMLALKNLKGLVIIDEIQRYPDIFPVIRVLADRPKNPARFIILGSASPNLLRQGSETLAGRIVYHELKGLALDEVGVDHTQRLWLRGGFPRSFLASSLSASDEWRRSFIKTYIERDLPQLGINIQSHTLYRFWSMLAHYHGQTWNASEFGRSFGIADTTVRHYLDLLASTFVVRLLLPWHENISKRQVRAPKVYIADSGLLHTLINVRTMDDLQKNPKIGASWEGLVIEQIIRRLNAFEEHCFFWATHSGAELDLFVIRGNKRLGFEVKLTSSPSITPSMKSAIATLKLTSLTVIHAGEKTYFLDKKVRAVAFKDVFVEI
ncbi:MAG: ATP-binding protein [Candidatus Omnitrophota bacterium]